MFKNKPLRIYKDGDSEPIFCLRDLCDTLDIKNVSQAAASVREKERVICKVYDAANRLNEMMFITEKAMYKLVMRSNKPEAEEYADWVAEVLIEIRSTGMYVPNLSPLDLAQQMLNSLVAQDKEIKALALRQQQADAKQEQTDAHLQAHDYQLKALTDEYPDYYTVDTYFNHINRVTPNVATKQAIGKAAANLSRQRNMRIRKIESGIHISNLYHESMLSEVVAIWDKDNQPPPSLQMKF